MTIERPKEKGQKRRTMIYKMLHRKLMIEKHKPHKKTVMNLGPASLVAPVILLLNYTNI